MESLLTLLQEVLGFVEEQHELLKQHGVETILIEDKRNKLSNKVSKVVNLTQTFANDVFGVIKNDFSGTVIKSEPTDIKEINCMESEIVEGETNVEKNEDNITNKISSNFTDADKFDGTGIEKQHEASFLTFINGEKHHNISTENLHYETYTNTAEVVSSPNVIGQTNFLHSFIQGNKSRTDKKPEKIRCKICRRVFENKEILSKHMIVHEGVKFYRCLMCNKSFTRRNILHDHMRIHTGEKPFKCAICSKTFSLKFYLKSHMQNHIKPFYCEVCNKSYAQKQTLDRHRRLHAKEKQTYNLNKANYHNKEVEK